MEEPRADQDRFIEAYAKTLPGQLFNEYNAFGGIAWQMEAGRRDNELFPERGSIFTISGKNMAGLNKARKDFSSYEASLSFFHAFRERSRMVLAVRVGGGINSGNYAFYQAQVLDGKTALRGFRETRFYGDSKLCSNFEVRLRLLNFRSYLFPAALGVLGFYDAGRVWYRNENGMDASASDGKSTWWHNGWGGGIWFTPFNVTILSAEIGRSNDGTLLYLRMGFLF